MEYVQADYIQKCISWKCPAHGNHVRIENILRHIRHMNGNSKNVEM